MDDTIVCNPRIMTIGPGNFLEVHYFLEDELLIS